MVNQVVATDTSYWAEGDTSSSKMTFFDANAMEPHIPKPAAFESTSVPEKLRDKVDLSELHGSRLTLKILLNQASDNGFSLVQVTAAPNTVMQRHKHNVDQVVWCVAGSMKHGNQVLEAGSGYFTPADHAYGWVAGPEGVTYIEFRSSPLNKTNTTFVEENPAKWGLPVDA